LNIGDRLMKLKGTIACEGIAKGEVVIIREVDDLLQVKEGSILVCEKTIPAMIIAMEKCSGIITEKGGITSHAAIVSRELNMPCLVGCAHAISSFKNGDLVVIDALKGNARKISSEEYAKIKPIKKTRISKSLEVSHHKRTDKLVIPLDQVREDDLSIVGGKASRLGEVFRKFKVPRGFCVTVKTYQDLYSNVKSKEEICSLMISSKVKSELLKIYHALQKPIAVRSSALLEDLPGLSFAGQYDTVLNVNTIAEFFLAIKKCFASYFNSRAIAYRHQHNIKEQPFMALLIQEMVKAEKSGVAFSVDPVKHESSVIVIEAVNGLGEQLVSGSVVPSQYKVMKRGYSILESTGNVLSKQEIEKISKMVHALEKYFGEAQDIEWAIEKGNVYLLQSRDVTNYSLDDLQKYFNATQSTMDDFSLSESWPLQPVQVLSYFDADEAMELNKILKEIRNKKDSEIQHLLPRALSLKYALAQNNVIGLKVAKFFGLTDMSLKDIENHLTQFIELLKLKQSNCPFDIRKSLIYSEEELNNVLNMKFTKVESISDLKKFIVACDALVYSLYYDLFISAGLERHGPYDVSSRFGDGAKMVVFDYFDIAPQEIWDHDYPCKKASIKLIYRACDIEIEFLGRIVAPSNFMDNPCLPPVYYLLGISKFPYRDFCKTFDENIIFF